MLPARGTASPLASQRPLRALVSIALAAIFGATLGCHLTVEPAGHAPAAASPAPAAQRSTRPADGLASAPPVPDGRLTVLTGKVKLIADAKARLIANNGGGTVSDKGVGLISDTGGVVVGGEPSGVISNNSGTIVSNDAEACSPAAVPALASFALADADIAFTDAAGKPVLDAHGAPLAAKTDAQGAYALRLDRPIGNMVARVALKSGGELTALIVPGGVAELGIDLDTATTLGAAYVLDRYVRGDQAVLDRLHRPEASRLNASLDSVRRYLAAAPSYRAAEMIVATEALRTREQAVGRAVEDVEALLGQVDLGNGQPATKVPLSGLVGLTMDRDGSLLVGEHSVGRVHAIAPDGTLTTLVDAGSGTIKTNFPRLKDLARGPDGSLYTISATTDIYRVRPDGISDKILGDAGALGGRAIQPLSIAVGPDNTVYVGEVARNGEGPAPRVVTLKPDGTTGFLDLSIALMPGSIWGLTTSADGAVRFAFEDLAGNVTIYRHAAKGTTSVVAAFADGQGASDLASDADGFLYLARPKLGKVLGIYPEGLVTTIVGPGTRAAAAGLLRPSSVARGPGALYVADDATALVYTQRPNGTWAPIAGTPAATQADSPVVVPSPMAPANSNCSGNDALRTCNISASFTMVIDLKTSVRTLPNTDLAQFNDQYVSFEPRTILAALRSRDSLNQVLERFNLRLMDDLNFATSNTGPYIYSFEAVVNDDPPRLTDLRKLVEESGVSGKYRFFTSSGANTFLTILEMRSGGEAAGVISADLNRYAFDDMRDEFGPINACASPK